MHVLAFFDGPFSEFVNDLDEAIDCGFENDFAFFGGGHGWITVYANVCPTAPIVAKADGVVACAV